MVSRFHSRAQVSVELIIIFAAVVAVALLLITQLQKTTKEGSEVIEDKAEDIFDQISDIK
ncbi:MAG: class III signal peptide-containing protein [Candidatus Diapherotrites archaeon]|nr:class III signal peptide-containing protein [Candidatus Diapherotrites archaeon]